MRDPVPFVPVAEVEASTHPLAVACRRALDEPGGFARAEALALEHHVHHGETAEQPQPWERPPSGPPPQGGPPLDAEALALLVEDLWPDVGLEGPGWLLGDAWDLWLGGASLALPTRAAVHRQLCVAAGLVQVAQEALPLHGLPKADARGLRASARAPVVVSGLRLVRHWGTTLLEGGSVDLGPGEGQVARAAQGAASEVPPAGALRRRMLLELWVQRLERPRLTLETLALTSPVLHRAWAEEVVAHTCGAVPTRSSKVQDPTRADSEPAPPDPPAPVSAG